MKQVINKISKAKTIGIFVHINADPDALGSAGALLYALKQLDKECFVFLNESVRSRHKYLQLENLCFKEPDKPIDLLISLDISSPSRLGVFENFFLSHTNTIEIDHHVSRASFAKLSLIKHYSSNAEIMYELIKELKVEITPHIATCIYTGIAGDTNGFSNGSTTIQSYKYAYMQVEAGANFSLVNKELFFNKKKFEIMLTKKILKRAQFHKHIVISYLTEKDQEPFDKKEIETGEFVDMLKTIEGIDISVVVKQVKGKQHRVSLRSNKSYSVAKFASLFGGGGHNQAAGMSISGNTKAIVKQLLKELKKLEPNK